MNSLLFDRLRPIGVTAALAASFDAACLAQAWPARVIEVQRETVTLDDGMAVLPARLHPHLARGVSVRFVARQPPAHPGSGRRA